MADTTVAYDTDKEPATAHDVTEGGIIGAVGGAIVGALAGGPIGAIIGAVAGGAASAGAVDVVDKHDHDYARTEYHNSADDVVVDDVATAPAAYREETSYAAAPVVDTAYTGTTALRDETTYHEAGMTGDKTVIPIVEEELLVGKRVEQTGGAHVHTEVIETPVHETVNLREEHVTIDRHATDRAATAADFATGAHDINITETREVPVVAKEARVVEEVVIGKTATERTETISDTVRKTDVVVD